MLFACDLFSLEFDLVALGREGSDRVERPFKASQSDASFDHLAAALGDKDPLVGLAIDPEGGGEVVDLQGGNLEDHDDPNGYHHRVDQCVNN